MSKRKRRVGRMIPSNIPNPSAPANIPNPPDIPAPDAAAGLAAPALDAPAFATTPIATTPIATTPIATSPIGEAQIAEALQTLLAYKAAKAPLEQRLIRNEQWYRLRHWDQLRPGAPDDVQPTSAWLFNAIANKHADAMDAFPSPNVLPREESDREAAQLLTAVLPVILDQCEFEQVYSDVADDKLKNGCGVYGVFWDKDRLGGLGDVVIRAVDLMNLFWEPGVGDIQDSRNLFHVELVDDDLLTQQYPRLKGRLGGGALTVASYLGDESRDLGGKTPVIDWYYKKRQGRRTVLHYCKFAAGTVLFATENETAPRRAFDGGVLRPPLAVTGWYDHGLYPFVFDPLFRIKGSPCGFGYIDIGASAQEFIDRGNQAILENLLANATPRHFIRGDGAVNEAEYLDVRSPLVHVDGNLGQDSIRPMQVNALSGIYVDILNGKIDELKETTGTRDVSTGGASGGVTAASAIAAMQEAGSKLSRDGSRGAYRAYRRMLLMVIELLRQFYDLPRCFRIAGENGPRFVRFGNGGLAPQPQGSAFGVELGSRVPLFDIEISAEKASPYSKVSQNELALQFFAAGFFEPQRAAQALACLEMMDFDRKRFVMRRIARNAGLAAPVARPRLRAGREGLLAREAGGRNGVSAARQNGGLARQSVADGLLLAREQSAGGVLPEGGTGGGEVRP